MHAPAGRARDPDRGQDLIGSDGGAPVAQKEVAHRQAAGAPRAHELQAGVENQPVGGAVGGGRGVAQIAPEGGGVLDLAAADGAGSGAQTRGPGGQRGGHEVAPGGKGTQTPAVSVLGDGPQRLDRGEVEDVLVDRTPDLGRVEVGATSQEAPRALGHGCQCRIQ